MHPLQQSGSPETIDVNSTKSLKSHDPQRWICYQYYLKELPFFSTQNLSEEMLSMLYQHPFDIITSEIWIRNNTNLP